MDFVTDFLYARPSFLSGVARLVDLFGTFDEYNRSLNGHIADARALRCDWGVIGKDMYRAIESELKAQKESPQQILLFK